MATRTIPIPSTLIPAGTTVTPFSDVTADVAGHTNYALAIDVTAWQPTDRISCGLEFRSDGATITPGGSITTTGGVHTDKNGNPAFPSVNGGTWPPFAATLEVRATITVPSAHNMAGTITLT